MIGMVKVGHRLKELRHRASSNPTGTTHDRDHLLALVSCDVRLNEAP